MRGLNESLHATKGFCQVCWDEAYADMMAGLYETQTEAYNARLAAFEGVEKGERDDASR